MCESGHRKMDLPQALANTCAHECKDMLRVTHVDHDDDSASFGDGLCEDFDNAKDEKLLAMLSRLASGSEDTHDVKHQGGSSPENGEPAEVAALAALSRKHDQDAQVHKRSSDVDDALEHAMQEECAAMLLEVHEATATRMELRTRLLRELQQLQERSSRQSDESRGLSRRLAEAKQILGERLQEASCAHTSLRSRIDRERNGSKMLQSAMPYGLKSTAKAAVLDQQMAELGEAQAKLVRELDAARDREAGLHSELQAERLKTWTQSNDVFKVFAQGPQASSAMDMFTGSGSPTSSLSLNLASPENSKKRYDELYMQLCREASARHHLKAEGSQEQETLQAQCRMQARRIVQLREEKEHEEAEHAQLCKLQDDLTARIDAMNHRPAVGSTAVDKGTNQNAAGTLALHHVHEANRLEAEIRNGFINYKKLVQEAATSQEDHLETQTEHQSLCRALHAEQENLGELLKHRRAVDVTLQEMSDKAQHESAELRHAEVAIAQQNQGYRNQIEEEKAEFEKQLRANDELHAALPRRNLLCPRRRPGGTSASEVQPGSGGQHPVVQGDTLTSKYCH